MGRIFSWEEIIEGKIPRSVDFKIAGQRVEVEICTNDKIVGALFFGSILRNDLTVQSDIDVLILYRGNIIKDLRELVFMAKLQFVPLQIIPLKVKIANRGIHTFNEGEFFSHLQWAAENGGVVKANPLRFIRIRKTEPKRVLERTFQVILGQTMRGICELSYYEGEKRMILLSKLLEAPMHIVRAVIWYKGAKNPAETNEKTIKFYCKIVKKKKLIELLQEILGVQKEYSEILERILKQKDRRPYEKKYEAILKKIEKTLEKVPTFIEANALLFFNK